MARKPTIDPKWKERARELRALGKSREAVQAALALEGCDVSAGWLSAAFKERPRPVVTEPPPTSAEGDGGAELDGDLDDLEQLAAVGDGATLDEVRANLGALNRILRRMLDGASGEEVCPTCGRGAADIDAVTKIGRVLAAAGHIIARHQPKQAPDPNEDPDMIICAKQAREKLHDLVERKRSGVGA